MEKIRLGRTDLIVSRTGFGAIPIQRISRDKAKSLLRRAFEAGINYFDTARGYTDSEEKIGYALSDLRERIIIATKTPAKNKAELLKDLDTSLRMLNTDYIDVYQMHNPAQVYEDVYEGLQELKQKGKINHIGITFHSREKAVAAVKSGRFDTLQFPLTFLSSPQDLELIELCKKEDVGLLAMKGLAGGLINNAKCAFVFLRQFENLVPLWGVEKASELEEFLALEEDPPALDSELKSQIEAYKGELSGDFCRACGYCMPCSVGINIPTSARIALLMSRMRFQDFATEEIAAQMVKVEQCTNCGVCKSRCPYELDVPSILNKQYAEYKSMIKCGGRS